MIHTNDLALALNLQLGESELIIELATHIDKVHSLRATPHHIPHLLIDKIPYPLICFYFDLFIITLPHSLDADNQLLNCQPSEVDHMYYRIVFKSDRILPGYQLTGII